MKILLAVDGTQPSAAAVAMLGNFRFAGGEIKIISIVEMAVPFAAEGHAGAPPTMGEIENAARENARRVAAAASRIIRETVKDETVSISTEILFGSPDRRIVETAVTMNADLIIVGSHGSNLWKRLLHGSVSEAVVHHAPCSVLIVKNPQVI